MCDAEEKIAVLEQQALYYKHELQQAEARRIQLIEFIRANGLTVPDANYEPNPHARFQSEGKW